MKPASRPRNAGVLLLLLLAPLVSKQQAAVPLRAELPVPGLAGGRTVITTQECVCAVRACLKRKIIKWLLRTRHTSRVSVLACINTPRSVTFQERVLIEAYRKCLSVLSQCHSGLPDGEQPISLSLAGHTVDTFRYQVSQDKVSIHLPVCRLLAGKHTHTHCVGYKDVSSVGTNNQ